MRHDQDHAIPLHNTFVSQRCRHQPSTMTELAKRNGFVVVLIDPCCDERAIRGRGLKRFDQIAVGKQPDIVDDESELLCGSIIYSCPLYS